MGDARSPLVSEILGANPRAYESLVVDGGAPALAGELLGGVKPEQLVLSPGRSPVGAHAMLAGLWLWHDALDECHHIAQKSPGNLISTEAVKSWGDDQLHEATATLAFWHAIMHRREGDFSNSKYWYARAAGHPVFNTLAGQAGALVNIMPADKHLLRLTAGGWDAGVFVDLVRIASESPEDSLYGSVIQLQHLEWRALFEYCARD